MGELIYVNFIPPYRGRIDEEDYSLEEEYEDDGSSFFDEPDDSK